MGRLPPHLMPENWLLQIFSSGEAARGGIVKRQICDVDRIVGRDVFLREVARRGFQVVENGRHFVVFCNAEPITLLRGKGLRRPLPARLASRAGRRFKRLRLALRRSAF